MAAVKLQHTLILVVVIAEDMQQRCHIEVAYHFHRGGVTTSLEHITDGLSSLIQTRIVAIFTPHSGIFVVILYILRRIVRIEVFSIIQATTLHTNLHRGLACLYVWFTQIVE